MAAGCVSLDLLPQSEIDRINALGTRLAARIRASLAASSLDLTLSSSGSIMNLRGDVEDLAQLYRAALDEGIYMAPRGMLCTSTAMDDAVIDDAAARIERAVSVVSDALAVHEGDRAPA